MLIRTPKKGCVCSINWRCFCIGYIYLFFPDFVPFLTFRLPSSFYLFALRKHYWLGTVFFSPSLLSNSEAWNWNHGRFSKSPDVHTHTSLLLLPNLASSKFHLGLSLIRGLSLLFSFLFSLLSCSSSFFPTFMLYVSSNDMSNHLFLFRFFVSPNLPVIFLICVFLCFVADIIDTT